MTCSSETLNAPGSAHSLLWHIRGFDSLIGGAGRKNSLNLASISRCIVRGFFQRGAPNYLFPTAKRLRREVHSNLPHLER
jgi:hypothetical protein